MSEDHDLSEAVAVIGMAGRFPGARDIDQFWRNLCDGVESIVHFSDDELLARGVSAHELSDGNYVKAASFLDDVELFDASFFGFNRREAEIIDPQQRIFLETAWEAFENAGYEPTSCTFPIGLYAGVGRNTYERRLGAPNGGISKASAYQQMIGNDKDYLTTRVAYKLNLRGPGVTVQTACSSSLVAVNFACQSLLMYQCDISLAGGVSINLSMRNGYQYQEGMILSPDGHCRAFDHRAGGTVSGEGVGIVVLKRLSEAIEHGDTIHAVIRGSSINNDGWQKVGYTAPSVNGQAEVIAAAQTLAEVDPETIGYVEAHGTGTSVGDPIEIKALTQAFRAGTDKSNYCAIGAVKTNIGHADAAAGVAGLIKTILALKHKQIPPSLHFERPSPEIDFHNSPFYVNTELKNWRSHGTPRRAGVSSFGIGGTNAHVILEEAPAIEPTHADQLPQLLLLAAHSEDALDRMARNLAGHFKQHPDACLADVAYTLQVGRKVFSHTRTMAVHDVQDAQRRLSSSDGLSVYTGYQNRREVPVVFLLPGQGSQHPSMAWDVYDSFLPFRRHVDECCEILYAHLGFDLREKLMQPVSKHSAAELNEAAVAEPAIFAISYSLGKCLEHLDIKPDCLLGYGVGEIAAACLGGVFTLQDALELVAFRAVHMQQLPRGGMLTVQQAESALSARLNSVPAIEIAAVNGPDSCVVAGPAESIELFRQILKTEGIASRAVQYSYAIHSAMMAPLVQPTMDLLTAKYLEPPVTPIISSITGKRLSDEQATNSQYWAKQILETVRFGDSIEHAGITSNSVLLEIGPGQSLSSLVRKHPCCAAGCSVLSTLPHAKLPDSPARHLLATLGRLWQSGVAIEWSKLHGSGRRQRVPLPTYPFQRQKYWLDEPIIETEDMREAPAQIAPDPNTNHFPDLAATANRYAGESSTQNDNQQLVQQQLRIMQQQLQAWSR